MPWLTGNSFQPAWPLHQYHGMHVELDVELCCSPADIVQYMEIHVVTTPAKIATAEVKEGPPKET